MSTMNWIGFGIASILNAYAFYCGFHNFRRWLKTRTGNELRSKVIVGTVLKDGYGNRYTVDSIGRDGCLIRREGERAHPLLDLLAGPSPVSWRSLAEHLTVDETARRPSDGIDRVLRREREE